jgi:hypothetical protein
MTRGRQKRTDRIPFGVLRQKLNLDKATEARLKREKLVPRWINDDDFGQRIKDAQSGGYEFVTADGTEKIGDAKELQDSNKAIKKLVGTHRDGSSKIAYLMAIPEEFYNEDQAAKEEVNMRVDNAIRGGNPAGLKHHGVDPKHGSTYKKNIKLE